MSAKSGNQPVIILGSGEYVPSRCVSSEIFDQRWGRDAGSTQRHTGVERRYFADAHETSSFMAARAAEQALTAAEMKAAELDCIISACSVMEQAIPCSAVLIQRQLNLGGSGIPAFDVNATCLSFLVAMELAASLIGSKRYRRILVVSSEIAAAGINWQDEETSAMFGDGAGAVVLGPSSGESGILASRLETYSEGADHCVVRSGGTRINPRTDLSDFLAGAHFEMSGRATYRMAARYLPAFLKRLLSEPAIELSTIDMVVPHQASAKALEHLKAVLKLNSERVIHVLDTRGNQMAASIPVALHQAIQQQRIGRGDKILLIGTGAGLSLGAIVLRY